MMRYPLRILAVVSLAMIVFAWSAWARPPVGPRELVGIRLGETVTEAGDRLWPGPPDRKCHREGLAMVPVAPMAGYRSGYVEVGQCAYPGRVARIKMHYADDSLEFFNKILAVLKNRYGDPTEWRGNAFGTLRTWKWSLTAADGSPISLILMYYAGDDGAFTQGNSIRLAASNLVRAEAQCQQARLPQGPAGQPRIPKFPSKKNRLEWFLPH